MMVPESIREDIKDWIWNKADALGWSTLPDVERAKCYELWTRDPAIGGRLAHFMDPRKVRVYIKDSLVKPYERLRLSLHEGDVWRSLSMPDPEQSCASYIKPHGRRLPDGKIVCWGKSREWKSILMAVFERAHQHPNAQAFGAVLLESGRTAEEHQRELVRNAADRLGIQRLAWI